MAFPIASINRGKLLLFVTALVGETDAEDVVQDVYVRLLEMPDGAFKGQSTFFTWVCAIAKNLAFDRLRAAARAPTTVSFEDLADSALAYTDLNEERLDAQLQLESVLKSLSPEEREIVETIEMSRVDAAAVLGLSSVSTYRNRLHQLRKRLREER